MKLAALASLFILLFAFTCQARQAEGELRIAEVGPYPYAAPGQIIELRVEGISERLISPPADGGLRILVTQDGSTKTASARTASPVIVRAPKELRAGAVRVTVENRGANGYSAPVVRTFELSERR